MTVRVDRNRGGRQWGGGKHRRRAVVGTVQLTWQVFYVRGELWLVGWEGVVVGRMMWRIWWENFSIWQIR